MTGKKIPHSFWLVQHGLGTCAALLACVALLALSVPLAALIAAAARKAG